MFIPFLIALLLGLISPANHQHTNCNGGGTVYVNSGDPGDPGNGDPGNGEPGSGEPGSGEPGSGDPGNGGSGGTGGPGGPTGDNGQIPPPKP